MLLRAAEVRTRDAADAAGAIATYRALVERFGWDRDVILLLVPLLEAERQWEGLAEALGMGSALSEVASERAGLLSQIGVLRASRLRDIPGGIGAFAQALSEDPNEKTARGTLEKLAAHGDQRIEAARVLEGVYRKEGAAAQLLKMLEVIGTFAATPAERLAALREAADMASGGVAEPARAVDLAGRGPRRGGRRGRRDPRVARPPRRRGRPGDRSEAQGSDSGARARGARGDDRGPEPPGEAHGGGLRRVR